MKTFLSAILIVSGLTVPALADDPKITGTFSITDDKNVAFHVEGDAAKALFDGMTGKVVDEECTASKVKSDKSGLKCGKGDDGKYSCDFGYKFKAHAFGDAGGGDDC